jgi:hypothetical protein
MTKQRCLIDRLTTKLPMPEQQAESTCRLSFWALLMVHIFLLAGCNKLPPSPMPYKTTENEEIKILKSEYSVSRFWVCGWNSTCPMKRWDYCLQVIPQDEEAALKWYQVYYGEELKSAAFERQLNAEPQGFVKALELLEKQDKEFKHQVFIEMNKGIRITAWYRINKAGKPDESTLGWQLTPKCYL